MKQLISMLALALTISLSMTAQSGNGSENQNQEGARIKEQKRAQENVKSDQNGTTVSTIAKETTSGPGKGEVVSTQAKTQGEVNKTEKLSRKELKDQKELKKQKELKDPKEPKKQKELKDQKDPVKQKELKQNKPGIEKQNKVNARGNRKPESIGRPSSTVGAKHVPR